MKKSLLTATLTIAAIGATLGGACLATGNCQAKSNTASARADSPISPAALKAAPKKAAPGKAAPKKVAPKAIKWHTSLDSALKESKRTGKPVFADFYATWCPPCKMLEEQTYPNPKAIAESQKWVMLKIDADKHPDLAVQYGIASLPTLAVLRANGEPVTGTTGFLSAHDFVKFLRDVRKEVVEK